MKLEYEQLWENIKYNSELAHLILGLSFPASASLLYFVIIGQLKPSLVVILASIGIAIVGYAAHSRLNYANDRFITRSKQIEKELDMYVWRIDDPKEHSWNLKRDLAQINKRIFRDVNINCWFKVYIFLLIIVWLILISEYKDLIYVPANLSIADKSFTIGNNVSINASNGSLYLYGLTGKL